MEYTETQEADCSFWNTIDETFLTNDRSNPARAKAAEIIREELQSVRGKMTVAEIGPCNGFDYEDYFKSMKHLSYTGIEGSIERCKYLQARFGSKLFEHGSFESLQNRKFSVLYTKATLEHQPHFAHCLQMLLRSARRLVVINWYIPPENATELIRWNSEIRVHWNQYNKNDVLDCIHEEGWTQIEDIRVSGSTNSLYIVRR